MPAAYDWTEYLDYDAQVQVVDPAPRGCTDKPHGYFSNNPSFRYRVFVTRLSRKTSGPKGGQTITIDGSGFGPRGSHDTVFFKPAVGSNERPVEAKDVHVVSSREIRATIPAESAAIAKAGGLADIKIETDSPVWFSAITRNSRFTYTHHA